MQANMKGEKLMDTILMPVKKMLAILFGVFFMLLTVGQNVNTITPLDADNIKLDLALMSDIHMEGNVPEKFVSISRCFNSLNGGKDCFNGLVITGDNSMCAQNIENMFFYGALHNISKIKNVYIASGNHDVGNDDEDFGTFEELRARQLGYINAFIDKDVDELYYSRVVNGYHLIFMGPDAAECLYRTLSDKQLDWFEAELDKAAASGLPIFVFNHHPYSCISEGHDRYISLLNKYDNIFTIVGHTHAYNDYGTVPGVKGTPEITVPSLSEKYTDSDSEKVGFGKVLEVYEDQVVIRAYDYYQGCFTGEVLTYTIK